MQVKLCFGQLVRNFSSQLFLHYGIQKSTEQKLIPGRSGTLPAFHGHAENISVNYSVYGYVESNGRH